MPARSQRGRGPQARASRWACLLAGLLAGACAPSPQPTIAWYKPGADDVQLGLALEACEAISGVSVAEVNVTDEDAEALERRRALTMCMRERGWVWGVSEPQKLAR